MENFVKTTKAIVLFSDKIIFAMNEIGAINFHQKEIIETQLKHFQQKQTDQNTTT